MDTQLTAQIIFWLYALVILLGGLVAVFSASLVRALVGLILTLFGVAGMYLLMAAPFIAIMQILIYVGAVTVLIFFAIMLTRIGGRPVGEIAGRPKDPSDEAGRRNGVTIALAGLAGLVPAALLVWVCLNGPGQGVETPAEVPIQVLGKALLNEYVLAFELISVVLFVAMAGAILLGFERRGK
jgi:NADH-quinone oxidoreductase subunit J